MQKIIALALVATSLVAFPVATPSFALDTSNNSLCGPDAPEGYKRPGGYCESIEENKSLFESDDGCEAFVPTSFVLGRSAKPVLVAEYCDYPDVPNFAAI